MVTGVNADGRSYVVLSEDLPDDQAVEIWNYEPAHVKDSIAAVG